MATDRAAAPASERPLPPLPEPGLVYMGLTGLPEHAYSAAQVHALILADRAASAPQAAAPITAEREAFEEWIKSPPYEHETNRFPEDEDKFAWPGEYRDITVALAWEAWQARAALSAPVAAQPAVSGVDVQWVEEAMELVDDFGAAVAELPKGAGAVAIARAEIRTHLSTVLTGAATTNTKE